MIELKHLKTLSILAQSGSLQATAEQLFVTQSALSHQLKQLEQRLGTCLFERKSQPVRFTAAGQELLALAQRVLPDVSNTTRRVLAEQQSRAELVLSVECHACFHWLLPAVRAFKQQFPALDMQFSADIEHDAVTALLKGDLDLVLTTDLRSEAQLVVQPLFELELVLLLSPEHSLAAVDYIQPAQLENATILSYPIPEERQDLFRIFLKDTDFHGRVRHVAQGSQIVQLVAAGQGVAALPRWMAQPYDSQGLLLTKALGAAGLWRPMYLLHRPDNKQQTALRDFAGQLQQAAPCSTRLL